ncbi:xanthine dehydrogenase family protein molybdopterin-binding subunit [Actinomycetospora sp. CA-084318]|uniref:xanthine dehydrogenase family protein molybdopterin-binding subunit n=1 Tax=Actinomycetospora sp. CA-084318 TaxID=3239892 RepID=UPI003D95BEFF
MTTMDARSMGTSVRRIEGPEKVTGTAAYAGDTVAAGTLALHPVQATVARGEITAIDTSAAEAVPGVVAVLTHRTAPRLGDTGDPEHLVLQGTTIHHRGQFVAAVLAEHAEAAAEAARLVVVSVDEAPSTTGFDPDAEAYTPSALGNGQPADSGQGDPEAALAAAPVVVRASYATPMEHHNPMEPHATTATWVDGRLEVREASQGVALARQTLATLFDVEVGDVTVRSPHVGGGFGTKGFLHAGTVLTVLAARTVPGRPVRFALGRRQMFETVGYRPATVQHMSLGASADGRLQVVAHDVVGATARYKEFVEPAGGSTRSMYAAPHRRTSHRAVPLDLDAPTYMRAPGEAPGSFGLECAMDELAVALDLDPIELRVRNEPEVHPETGLPFSSRGLVECLRTGAERFGWSSWERAPRRRLVDGWWHGVGVGCGTFPAFRMPGSTADITFTGGRYVVAIGASDIGQGARTVLTQIAADALGVDVGSIAVEIGSTEVPVGSFAGGSAGTASWGSTVVEAADRFRDKYGDAPDEGDHADAATPDNPWAEEYAMAAHCAQFAEVAVHADTGEIRVPRLFGMFGVGRILNPALGRSQLQGGMVWGLSMALHEESVVDPRFGEVINHDFAGYHVAANADVRVVEAEWIDEDDPYVNPMGAKGIGEIGIVGVAAAVANAVYHATGVRVRSLPITCDDVLTSGLL